MRFIWTVITLFFCSNLSAQVDSAFWFGAPELQVLHGDDPIVLRITAQNNPINVTISEPADTSFQPISVSIPANTSITVDLTPFKDKIKMSNLCVEIALPTNPINHIDNGDDTPPQVFETR